jgi:hypothetical protein
MAEVYKVARPFERYDEKLKAPRRYRRGDVISMKDAARMSSLGVLLGAGNIYRMPEEQAREVTKPADVPATDAPAGPEQGAT